ncbi:hypothetical protein JKP88DRAFT_275030 [Tribonema minus]|uniref:Uncharacterized protein n=1 Tax=Tribonema minus TaxID=303371 RepID=A0A835ZAU5_9STRA|nr:hypothetical protein JKP88DRAFT_275030 [Tribonema minus]
MAGSEIQILVTHLFVWRQLPGGQAEPEAGECVHALHEAAKQVAEVPRHVLAMLRRWGELQRDSPDGHTVVVKVFRTSASNDKVVSSHGAMSGVFPAHAVRIPLQRIQGRDFAKQVADLCNTACEEMRPAKTGKGGMLNHDDREPPRPAYVIEWLFSALAAESGVAANGVVRDCALAKSASERPFRRSAEWTAVKAVLHSELVAAMGSVNGKLVYMTVIARALVLVGARLMTALGGDSGSGGGSSGSSGARALVQAGRRVMTAMGGSSSSGGGGAHDADTSLRADLGMQMFAKVALRLRKLEALAAAAAAAAADRLLNAARAAAAAAIDAGDAWVQCERAALDSAWADEAKHRPGSASVDPSRMDLLRDTSHQLLSAGPHITAALSPAAAAAPRAVGAPACAPRLVRAAAAMSSADVLKKVSGAEGIADALGCVEWWVREELWPRRRSERWDVPALWALQQAYAAQALPFYAPCGDALGASRMVLTVYALVAEMEGICRGAHALLRRFRTGLPPVAVLEALLLPGREDMELLRGVEAEILPWQLHGLGPSMVDDNDFAIAYARDDRDMRRTRDEILSQAETNWDAKLEELHQIRIQQREVLNNPHDYFYRHRLQILSRSVVVFEEPLPTRREEQFAVVFELRAPDDLAALRDACHAFNVTIAGRAPARNPHGTAHRWRDHAPLREWWCYAPSTDVGLISTSHGCHRSHQVQHTDDSQFRVPSGYSVGLGCSGGLLPYDSAPAASVAAMCTMLARQPPYASLQWAIGSHTHTENDALAAQCACPQDLDLGEFRAFCTLRAGTLLQLRNVLRAVEARSLSLETSGVHALIAQTLWQAGPHAAAGGGGGGAASVWHRAAHADLADAAEGPAFCGALVHYLGRLLDDVQANWTAHGTLLVVIELAARALELCGDADADAQGAAAALLLRCRGVATDWCARIEHALRASLSDGASARAQGLRLQLVTVAAYAALTFGAGVRAERCAPLLVPGDAPQLAAAWLRCRARLHDNVLLDSSAAAAHTGADTVALLRRAAATAAELEPMLHAAAAAGGGAGISAFVRAHWGDAGNNDIAGPWTRCGGAADRWYEARFAARGAAHASRMLHVALLSGAFLVDGAPVGRLPAAITSSGVYARTFGGAVLPVQPAGRAGVFVTTAPGNAAGAVMFTFEAAARGVVISERRPLADGAAAECYELLPHDHFRGDLPHQLVEGYSHWLRVGSGGSGGGSGLPHGSSSSSSSIAFVRAAPGAAPFKVLFRPIRADDAAFPDLRSMDAVPFEMEGSSGGCVTVTQRRTSARLVDVRSASFEHLFSRVIWRLELRERVHVWAARAAAAPAAAAARGGGSSGGGSADHGGVMRVAASQSFGALIGLKHSLLLEDARLPPLPPQRKVIVPHGDAYAYNAPDGATTATVTTALETIASPPYFVYAVDDALRQLRPSEHRLAALHLARLHAATAAPLPDPLTGVTGTESAMLLLRSGRCWRLQPLDPLAQRAVRWPAALPSCAAHAALAFAARALATDGERLRVHHPAAPPLDDAVARALQEPRTGALAAAAYRRACATRGALFRLEPAIEQQPPPAPAPAFVPPADLHDDEAAVAAVRAVAESGERWLRGERGCNMPPRSRSLHALLLRQLALDGAADGGGGIGATTLRGVSASGFVRGGSFAVWRAAADALSHEWLDLYRFARAAEAEGRTRELALLLSLLAHRMPDRGLVHALAAVARNATAFAPPPLPRQYSEPGTVTPVAAALRAQFARHTVSLEDYVVSVLQKWFHDSGYPKGQTYEQRRCTWLNGFSSSHSSDVARDLDALTAAAAAHFPARAVDMAALRSRRGRTIKASVASTQAELDALLSSWSDNCDLQLFLGDVGARLATLRRDALRAPPPSLDFDASAVARGDPKAAQSCLALPPPRVPLFQHAAAGGIWATGRFAPHDALTTLAPQPTAQAQAPPPPLPLRGTGGCPISAAIMTDMRASWRACFAERASPPAALDAAQLQVAFRTCRTALEREAQGLWDQHIAVALDPLPGSAVEAAMAAAGAWRAALPCSVLPLLLPPNNGAADGGGSAQQQLHTCAGAWAVLMTLLQRCNGCLRLLGGGDGALPVLRLELANGGHEGWAPSEHPEWLLLELEGGFLGKTSVILPMLAATLADGDNLMRITVPSPLFAAAMALLSDRLGGLLGRRLYTLPVRRDMDLGVAQVPARPIPDSLPVRRDMDHGANTMLAVLRECRDRRGVLLILPEHRASLQLKQLDCARRVDAAAAAALHALLRWSSRHARNVIDEVAEVLRNSFQLVYTVGAQEGVDGGVWRWRAATAALRAAAAAARALAHELGDQHVEFEPAAPGSGGLPRLRLLSHAAGEALIQKTADALLMPTAAAAGGEAPLPVLRGDELALLRLLLLEPRLDGAAFATALALLPEGGAPRAWALTLRGLLAHSVLLLALRKRWRIDHGVTATAGAVEVSQVKSQLSLAYQRRGTGY